MTAMNSCVLSFESLWMVVSLSHVGCARQYDLQVCSRLLTERAPKIIHVSVTTISGPQFRDTGTTGCHGWWNRAKESC